MELTAQEVAQGWFSALKKGDVNTAVSFVDENVEWVNTQPTKGVSDILPWIGTYHGRENFLNSLNKYYSVCDVIFAEPMDFIVQGNTAAARVHERGSCKATGKSYEIEFALWIKIENGKIKWWKSYTDVSPLVAAFRND
jgi:ketosteroid isomerase-like protein